MCTCIERDPHRIISFKIIINCEMTCTKWENSTKIHPEVQCVLLDTIMILIIFVSLLTSTPRVFINICKNNPLGLDTT